MKIVINKKVGGFGLSSAAMNFMAEHGVSDSYYEEHKKELNDPEAWWQFKIDHWEYEGDRGNPVLVDTVETLGSDANGDYAALKIVEIPDGVQYKIISYFSGIEYIEEKHRIWE